MTREEAMKTIESAKNFAYDVVYEKAFDMAIKALEQEPCEDCIKIPEGATNRDMIKAMFPDAEVIAVENEEMEIVEYVVKIDDETVFTADWWNSPYRKEQE